MRFEGQVAIITGAASGIGQASAIQLENEGASVVLVDLQDCTETINHFNDKTNYLEQRGDIRDKSFIKSVVDATMDKFGVIHNIVKDEGTCGSIGLVTFSEDNWDWDLD